MDFAENGLGVVSRGVQEISEIPALVTLRDFADSAAYVINYFANGFARPFQAKVARQLADLRFGVEAAHP